MHLALMGKRCVKSDDLEDTEKQWIIYKEKKGVVKGLTGRTV